MITKTRRPFIAALAALLCVTAASAQDNRAPPSSERRVRPTPSGSALATFPTLPESSSA